VSAWQRFALPIVIASAAIAGCRGGKSEDPPFHLIGDMQWQAHRLPQSESPTKADGTPLFDDNRSNRKPDVHTVARGRSRLRPGFADGKEDGSFLKIDDARYKGVDTAGKPLARVPFEVTKADIDRGHERFNIYCAPCHDKSGSGHGLIGQHAPEAFGNMPDFGEICKEGVECTGERLRKAPDGELFQTITNGKGRMPAYAAQIPEDDRWKIVTWLRVLQTSQHTKSSEAGTNNIEPAESEAKCAPP